MRKQFGKVFHCLFYQRGTIGKEKHVFNPIVPHQHIHERNGDPCFARPCRHDQQPSPMEAVQVLTNGGNRPLLVFPVGYFVVNAQVGNGLSVLTLDKQLQVFTRVKPVHPSWRVSQAVNAVNFIPVGVVDYRFHAISRLQAVGVQFRLMFPY